MYSPTSPFILVARARRWLELIGVVPHCTVVVDVSHLTKQLLITEFMQEVSPLLPNPCHFQNYDQTMSQLNSDSEGSSPKMCADEGNDEHKVP